MENKIDVAVNVYGKPYHTLVALLTLLKYSEKHIDKIYVSEEINQPHNDNINHIFSFLPKEKIIHYKPEYFLGYDQTDYDRLNDEKYRHSIRYQYAFEKTDKDYLFIMHNDVLFMGDIIGNMIKTLDQSEDVGMGHIGMCWRCPAYHEKICDGNRYDKLNLSYDEAVNLVKKYPTHHTKEHHIDKKNPMPLPDCRLNEFFALLKVKRLKNLIIPFGDVTPFGAFTFEIGTSFFKELVQKGYRFKQDNELTDKVQHGWVSIAGHPLNTDKDKYYECEAIAKEYLHKHLLKK